MSSYSTAPTPDSASEGLARLDAARNRLTQVTSFNAPPPAQPIPAYQPSAADLAHLDRVAAIRARLAQQYDPAGLTHGLNPYQR
jgi:hypothetical protein